MFELPLPSGTSPHLRRAGSRPTFAEQGRMKNQFEANSSPLTPFFMEFHLQLCFSRI